MELNTRDEWVGKSLKELNLRKKYSVNVVAFRKNGKITAPVSPDELLDKTTELIAIVNTSRLSKLK